jgi:hypothetical protein
MAEKTKFVLGANFGTPYGSGSQLIFFCSQYIAGFTAKTAQLILYAWARERL